MSSTAEMIPAISVDDTKKKILTRKYYPFED